MACLSHGRGWFRTTDLSALYRRDDPGIWEAAHWQPTHRVDLLSAREHGRLHDPANEHFIARRRLDRRLGDVAYRSSEFLYSHHQLILLPIVRVAAPLLTYRRASGEVDGIDVHPVDLRTWRATAGSIHELVVALTALEPIYYPKVIRRIRYSGGEFDEYERWLQRLGPRAMLTWLGVDANWIRTRAAGLLRQADGFDPLGKWADLVREADPDRWDDLNGTARSAVDLRVGAEILLRYYERLVRGRRAPSIEPGSRPVAERVRLPPQAAGEAGRCADQVWALTASSTHSDPRGPNGAVAVSAGHDPFRRARRSRFHCDRERRGRREGPLLAGGLRRCADDRTRRRRAIPPIVEATHPTAGDDGRGGSACHASPERGTSRDLDRADHAHASERRIRPKRSGSR